VTKNANKTVSKMLFCLHKHFASQFQYLGRWLDDDDADISPVFANIRKAQRQWGLVRRLLCRQGASRKVMVHFYLTIVQSVLLYGSETWVLSQYCLRRLEAFHHKCARWLCGRHIRRLPDNTWEYPPSIEVLAACALSPLQTYIAKRRTTLLQYATTSSVLYQTCVSASPSAAKLRPVWWRNQLGCL
jgi:hypothetical protein